MNYITSIVAAASLLATAYTHASFDTYLLIENGTVDELNGESQTTGREKWHELLTFELGAENSINIGSISAGGGVGKATFKEFKITKEVNKASPKLFSTMAVGRHFDAVKLEAVRSGGAASAQAFYTVELGLVMIEDITWSGSNGDDIVEETVIFQFGNGRVTYKAQGQTGEIASTHFAYWDRVSNSGSSGSDGGGGGGEDPTPIAPSISGTTSKTIARNTSSSFNFSISDGDTEISSITSSVTSLNTALIPSNTLSITGTGSTRTVNFTANDTTGSAKLRITVNDGTYTRTRDVTIQIVELNAAPSAISPSTIDVCQSDATALSGLYVNDTSSPSNHTVTIEVSSGQLEIATNIPNGLTASHISGNGSSLLSINAPIDLINTTLSNGYGLQFTPASTATVDLELYVNDNDPLNSLSSTATTQLRPILNRYEIWERTHFTEAERLSNESDPLNDGENDSIVNLIEFAFNLDPDEHDHFALETEMISAQGLSYMEVTFPIRTNAPNLEYIIQRYDASTKQWEESGFTAVEVGTPTTISPEFESITIRLLDPVEEVDTALVRLFIRYSD